jgi:RNA polymerase-binding transcription factor DksA
MSLSLLESEEHRLEEINAALERIEQGTFGHCEACGIVLSTKRLNALPFARLCVDCARRQEESVPPGTL